MFNNKDDSQFALNIAEKTPMSNSPVNFENHIKETPSPYNENSKRFVLSSSIRNSAGEETYPYVLFHGETALRKILKFQGETANFPEKFQGEIAEFHRENMELYRQNLKISGRNTCISWRKYWISWRNFPLFLPEKHYFSQKKRQLIMEKNKKLGFFFTCTVHG